MISIKLLPVELKILCQFVTNNIVTNTVIPQSPIIPSSLILHIHLKWYVVSLTWSPCIPTYLFRILTRLTVFHVYLC